MIETSTVKRISEPLISVEKIYVLLTMKYMGSQIIFNILKNQKILQTNWLNATSPTTWESDFADIKFSAESQR